MKIILASQSPRRRAILDSLGIQYEVIVPNCDEDTNKIKPEEIVTDLALQKAKNVASRSENSATIIAADTIVYLEGKILGKPKDEDEAFEMLNKLQNNWHTVYTGVCIFKGKTEVKNYFEKADVHMAAQSEKSIWEYIKTGDPMDKAGAYGVQDSTCNFVDQVKGEIETVIGLPIKRLKEQLN